MPASADLIVLRAAGVGLALDATGTGLPRVLHWGADLGEDALDLLAAAQPVYPNQPLGAPLLPTQADRWAGQPALAGHRDGTYPHLRLLRTEPVAAMVDPAGGGTVTVHATDEAAGVRLRTEIELGAQGVLRMRHAVTSTDAGTYTVDGLLCLLPVPADAVEVLDFTGRWSRERVPQRTAFGHQAVAHESRRGRTGFDAPPFFAAGTAAFGFRHGQVWGVHVGWSGDHTQLAQRTVDGDGVLGGGELLGAGEIRLGDGETYTTPWVYFCHSPSGLDGLSDAMHAWLRARDTHPRTPRPVTLNTWEAVYFDHDLTRLTALARTAAELGVERFVLDDGWFLGRRDDTAGLGDWHVDPTVWPDGLHPLVDEVRRLGLQFGLWVEPEMINPDSDLARAHPDWYLATPDRLPANWRHQQVLDLARPEVWAHLLQRLDALVTEYRPDYLKWDHNRDLVEAVHDGTAGVHAQTAAAYRLLDALRARHPHLEIESCSSGGARVDLGILSRTDRVWASDNNDPLERQHIQRWTALLLPPELMGSHVGPPVSHTNGRAANLSFRCLTALFGHAGIEWDITGCTEDERAQLSAWIGAYRRLRGLLHSGRTVRADHPDPSAHLYGIVSTGGEHAVFAYAQLTASAYEGTTRLRLPGLDPLARYRVGLVPELPVPRIWAQDWSPQVTLTGAALAGHGLAAPLLRPADGFVLELHRVG
ncbi:alpha-galactosidase [Catellatospora sp. KI3]|uniref:alpha-galactosidase n=1 Tax=Catellatospora sp. KI3 TaxID=3041620 RepID=UPI0024827ADB|nr:alpha-galactosidase [Catellatospora sp. KI3]MDI1465697.1 alpha-galactosidase [Catellatospora sp. KI3]